MVSVLLIFLCNSFSFEYNHIADFPQIFCFVSLVRPAGYQWRHISKPELRITRSRYSSYRQAVTDRCTGNQSFVEGNGDRSGRREGIPSLHDGVGEEPTRQKSRKRGFVWIWANSPSLTPPVNINFETNRSIPIQYCAAKKVKLPEFGGYDPRGWISKAELYFEIHGTAPELRIRLAQLSMTGVAQHWFSVVRNIHDNLSWEQFTRELLQQFRGLEIQNPYEQLATIKQVDSVHDFIDDFEYLLYLIPRLPESQALGYFLAGLRLEIKQWVRLQRPQTRLDAMYIARDVEQMLNPSDLTRLNSRYRYQTQRSHSTFVGPSIGPMGSNISKAQSGIPNFERRTFNRGIRWLGHHQLHRWSVLSAWRLFNHQEIEIVGSGRCHGRNGRIVAATVCASNVDNNSIQVTNARKLTFGCCY